MRVMLSGRSLQNIFGTVLFVSAFIVLAVPITHALAKGYLSQDSGLQPGMVVSLSTAGGSSVERASLSSSDLIVGVMTTYDSSSVTVSSEDSKVLIESDGEVTAYVSDVNGEIQAGDLLVISSLRGILAKKDDSDQKNVVALASSGTSDMVAQSVEGVNDGSKIYKITINLDKQGIAAASGSVQETTLSKLGKSLVGRDVGEIRVLIALLVFMIVLIAEGGIIYGAVSSAITALGRNPLARKVIQREMLQVFVVAIIVLVVGLGAMYAILWI